MVTRSITPHVTPMSATPRSEKGVVQMARSVTIDDEFTSTFRPWKHRLCTPKPTRSALGNTLLVATACRTPRCPMVEVGFYHLLSSENYDRGSGGREGQRGSDVVENRT